MIKCNAKNIMKNFFNPYSLLAIYILIIVNFNIINACYITNCPWGGKRSQPIESLLENPRQVKKKFNQNK